MASQTTSKPLLSIIFSLSLLSFSVLSHISSASAESFSDIRSPILAEAVDYLSETGIIKGYPDGNFKPDQSINRAEALKIIFESLNTDIPNISSRAEKTFPDVDNKQWFAKYVSAAKQKNLIKGYADGSYKPTQFVNRAEFVKISMLAQAHYKSIQNTVATDQYSDLAAGEWYLPYLAYGLYKNFLTKSDRFRPSNPMTRGDAAMIIYRVAQYNQENPAETASRCDEKENPTICSRGINVKEVLGDELFNDPLLEVREGVLYINGRNESKLSLDKMTVKGVIIAGERDNIIANTTKKEKLKAIDTIYQDEYQRILEISGGIQLGSIYDNPLGYEWQTRSGPIESACNYVQTPPIQASCRLELEYLIGPGDWISGYNYLESDLSFDEFRRTDEGKILLFDLIIHHQYLDRINKEFPQS